MNSFQYQYALRQVSAVTYEAKNSNVLYKVIVLFFPTSKMQANPSMR